MQEPEKPSGKSMIVQNMPYVGLLSILINNSVFDELDESAYLMIPFSITWPPPSFSNTGYRPGGLQLFWLDLRNFFWRFSNVLHTKI